MIKKIFFNSSALILFLCSFYFFHPSYWSSYPATSQFIEAERVGIVTDWVQNGAPSNEYNAQYALYNVYLSLGSKLLLPFLSQLGYPLDISNVILLLSRLLSALFAMLSIILLYDIAIKLFDPLTAFLASLLLLLTPIFAVYCQTGTHQFHTMFFTILAYHQLTLFLTESRKNKLRFRAIGLGITSALLFSINMYGTQMLMVAAVLLGIYFYKNETDIKKITCFILIPFIITFILSNLYFFKHPDWLFMNIFLVFVVHIAQKNYGLQQSIFDSVRYMLPHTLGLGIFLSFLTGLIFLGKEWKTFRFQIQFILTLAYSLPALIAGINMIQARMLLVAPFLIVTAAYGLSSLVKNLYQKKFGYKMAAITIIFVVIFLQWANCWAWLNAKSKIPYLQEDSLKYLNQYLTQQSLDSKKSLNLILAEELNGRLCDLIHQPNVKLFEWSIIDAQSSSMERFKRIPFDFAICKNLDVFDHSTEIREKKFRQDLMAEIESSSHWSIVKTFEPEISFLGCRFYPPLNNPGLAVVVYPRLFLIENHIKDQTVTLKNSIKKISQEQEVVIINTHSDFSHNGIFSLQEISQKLQEIGVQIWIPTDCLFRNWAYKLGPVKKYFFQPSILQKGLDLYLGTLKNLEANSDKLVIIPGIEVIPNYYWTGNPLRTNLQLNDGSKNLLILGLEKLSDYQTLPIPDPNRAQEYRGEKPYQDWIDNAVKKKGLVFWSHPHSQNSCYPVSIGMGSFLTLPYDQSIVNTKNHQGFAVLGEGLEAAEPGGVWDQILLDYCRGNRSPAFVIGESQYGKIGKSSKEEYPYLFTVLLKKSKNKREILEMLKEGRSYAVRTSVNGQLIQLKKFQVSALNNNQVRLNLEVDNLNRELKLVMICNGKIIKQEGYKNNFTIVENLKLDDKNQKLYFRITVSDDLGGMLVSNPIFVDSFARKEKGVKS